MAQKTAREQIAGNCIHFTGIQNKVCKIGISYDSVKDKEARPFRWPCISTGGHCDKCQLPTAQEVEKELREIGADAIKALDLMIAAKNNIKASGNKSGHITCNAEGCGGQVSYTQFSNGHTRGHCDRCQMGWVE